MCRSSPPIAVLQKRCSAKTQQIYRRSSMQRCDFNKVELQTFLHKSAFLGMSASLDGIKIKFITMVLTSVMLVIIYWDSIYYQ